MSISIRSHAIAVLALIALCGFFFAACASTGDATVSPVDAAGGGPTLAEAYRDYFPIGAAIEAGPGKFNSLKEYPESVLAEYSALVAENCMKASLIQPREGEFAWGPADSIAAYAREKGLYLRGHTLVWHNQAASWMFPSTGTQAERRALVRARLKAHVEAVVGRYKDDVRAWDVVNEAVKDAWSPSSWKTIWREDSPWYQAYGDATYIQDAFDFARAADPDAVLFYNDYNICDPRKRERVVEMIETLELKKHGLRGIGIQGHWSLTWPHVADIQETIDTFHEMGLEVQITELDIDCYNNSDSTKTLSYKNFETALAARYREIFGLLRKNKDKISAVTFWGVADDHTWLDTFYGGSYRPSSSRKNYPLLFGVKRERKKAYYAVRDFERE